MTQDIAAISWQAADGSIRLLDQRLLPDQERYLRIDTVDELVDAIVSLAVRGAPALGAAGALGVVVALRQAARQGWDAAHRGAQIDRIRRARPTAVNLAWGVDQVAGAVDAGPDAVLSLAERLIAEDTAACRRLSSLGADWIEQRVCQPPGTSQPRRIRAITHCNTGALATTGWGTAYGILHELHRRGRLDLVYVDETRPLWQGARLTSWELTHDGIDHVVQVDGAAASTILRGLVDVALFGADRIAANGDTANKIGSVALALASRRAGIPLVVAAPGSTIDLTIPDGAAIDIEERDGQEVLTVAGRRIAPAGARAFNPAFDVTPHDLIDAIVTEHGIVEPAAHPAPDLLARIAGPGSPGAGTPGPTVETSTRSARADGPDHLG